MFYNQNTNKYYYGGSITVTLADGSLWSGVPTNEQLREWGYEEYVPPVEEMSEEDFNQQPNE